MIVDRWLPWAVTLDPRASKLAEGSSYELPALRLPRAGGSAIRPGSAAERPTLDGSRRSEAICSPVSSSISTAPVPR
jgi:hypothetical protein